MGHELDDINAGVTGMVSPEEAWKPIPGYEGLYEVSSLGRVKASQRVITRKDGRCQIYRERILSLFHSRQGYVYIVLTKDNKPIREAVHRLVAKAFISNMDKARTHIDHIDGDRANNTVLNIRWVTRAENMHNPITEARIDKAIGKSVIGISPEGIKKEYHQIKDVEVDGFSRQKVCSCCRGKRKSHKGYKWEYKNEPRDNS